MKKSSWVVSFIILFIFIFFITLSYNKNNILNSWEITIQSPYNYNVIYESERGFGNDGEKIIKISSEKLDYKIDCVECYKVIELDKDIKLISEMIKRENLEDEIDVNDLRILDSVKKNKINNDYFKYLIITFDNEKKIYYIFERII